MPEDLQLKETPYWMEPNPHQDYHQNKRLPSKTDVLIIGGGYTGLAAAFNLSRAGMQVTVIDRGAIAGDASSKNGGMVLPGVSGDIRGVEKTFGKEAMRQFFAETVASVDSVERHVRHGNIDCHFVRCGYLEAAAKPSHVESLKRDQEFYATCFQHPTQLLMPDDIRSEIDTDYYYGGLIDESGGGIQPAEYAAGLAKMAAESGAGLYAEVEAKEYARHGSAYQVETNKGRVIAKTLVIATNGHTPAVSPWLQRRIIPFDSYMIATEILPPGLAESLIPQNRMCFDTKNILYYFRLSPDKKRLLFGGRAKIASSPVRAVSPLLHQFMLGVFPQLEPYKVEYAWSGRVCFTFDRFPHIGCQGGLYYALGYCGHGVAMATYFGEKVADMIVGKDTPTIFAAKLFRTLPFYSGTPWFLPLVQLYFKLLDRLP